MKDIFILLVHLLTTVAKLLGPGGTKAVIAENLLLKQQLLVVTRSRRRAPNLSNADRFLMGFWSLFLQPGRIAKVAVSIRPSTLSKFHQYLVRRKYSRLFSSRKRTKPGPKGAIRTTHLRHCRAQTPQSGLRLPSNRPDHLKNFWY